MSLYVLRPDGAQGEILEALSDAFVLDRGQEERESLTFLDTFDWRLLNRGLTLTGARLGNRAILTLQGETGDPRKLRLPGFPGFARELPPGPFRERVYPVTGIRRLLPRARLRSRTWTAAVLNEDLKTVVRLRLTGGEAAFPGSKKFQPLPDTIEILPLKGYGDEARRVGNHLRKSFGLRPVKKRLLTLAMESLGEPPGPDPSAPTIRLDPEMRASEGARAIHRALLSVMKINEEGVIRDLDPEFLHDYRVAIRRARAALGQIQGVVTPEVVEHFGGELKWMGSRTGPSRDMDVHLIKIPRYQEALPEGVRDHLEPMVRFLERKKKAEHRRLVRTLRTKRYRAFMEEWTRFLEEGEPDTDLPAAAREPLARVASARIWKLYRKVVKGGMEAGDDASPEALHRLRIQCKRLRYIITLFQSLYPESQLRPILKALKGLQDNLGDFNDLHVQQVALRQFADEMLEMGAGPPETLMAMGRLMGQMETQQEVERSAFAKRFQQFAEPRNLKRFEKLFNPMGRGPPGD